MDATVETSYSNTVMVCIKQKTTRGPDGDAYRNQICNALRFRCQSIVYSFTVVGLTQRWNFKIIFFISWVYKTIRSQIISSFIKVMCWWYLDQLEWLIRTLVIRCCIYIYMLFSSDMASLDSFCSAKNTILRQVQASQDSQTYNLIGLLSCY